MDEDAVEEPVPTVEPEGTLDGVNGAQAAAGAHVRGCGYNLRRQPKRAQHACAPDFSNSKHGTVHVTVEQPGMFQMSEEDTVEHVLGVVMAQQHSLKKGLDRIQGKCDQGFLAKKWSFSEITTFDTVTHFW